MFQATHPPLDLEADKHKALAKIYSLLIKLAEEEETTPVEVDQNEEFPEPLKTNIPT